MNPPAIHVTLPMPPSDNMRLRDNLRHTEQYRAFKREVAVLFIHQPPVKVLRGPLVAMLDVHYRTAIDVDNIEKPIWDALKHRAFDDDGQILRCIWRKFQTFNHPRVEVHLYPMTRAFDELVNQFLAEQASA